MIRILSLVVYFYISWRVPNPPDNLIKAMNSISWKIQQRVIYQNTKCWRSRDHSQSYIQKHCCIPLIPFPFVSRNTVVFQRSKTVKNQVSGALLYCFCQNVDLPFNKIKDRTGLGTKPALKEAHFLSFLPLLSLHLINSLWSSLKKTRAKK